MTDSDLDELLQLHKKRDYNALYERSDEVFEYLVSTGDLSHSLGSMLVGLTKKYPSVVFEYVDELGSIAEQGLSVRGQLNFVRVIGSSLTHRVEPEGSAEKSVLQERYAFDAHEVPADRVELLEPLYPYLQKYAITDDLDEGEYYTLKIEYEGDYTRNRVRTALAIWSILAQNGVELPDEVFRSGYLHYAVALDQRDTYVGTGILLARGLNGGEYASLATGTLVQGLSTGYFLFGNETRNATTIAVARLICNDAKSVRDLSSSEFFNMLERGAEEFGLSYEIGVFEGTYLAYWKLREYLGVGMFEPRRLRLRLLLNNSGKWTREQNDAVDEARSLI